jgi:hypothetical protein
MIISDAGITVDLPEGWEGSIRPPATLADGARRHSVTHLANFPLPPVRGEYGSGAVDLMTNGDVLIVLLEFGPESAGTALFDKTRPPFLRASDFSRDTLQQREEGHGGCQRFFTEAGRPFCLYVVVGDYIDRVDVLEPINNVLGRVTIT